MNILIITPKIPYPLTEGGKVSQFAIIDYLRKKNSVILVLATYSSEDENNLIVLKNLWPEVTIEKIKMWNTRPQIQEKLLQKTEKQVLFISRQMWSIGKKFAKRLLQKDDNQHIQSLEIDSPWVIQIAGVKERKFINELLNIVNKYKIDIIQIDLLEYIDLVLALPQEIKKVFVQHEFKFARLATTLKTLPASSTPFDNYVLDFVKSQEINLLRLYDGVFVFSEGDRKKLADAMPGSKIFVTPFPVLNNFFRPIKPELLKIKKLVFVGGEDPTPNKNAVEWYINEIGNEVKKRQDLILHVVGKWSKETIEKYRGNGLVFFPGYVEDLISYCENSISVVPVRIGSGIRAKILYSMAQGVPVVSASIGCEGIEVKDKTDLLIANNPKEFAEAIHSIVTNPDLSYKMVTNAQRLIREKYSQEAAGALRQHYLNELINKS
jgi:glycosyltransferase involved in cell wall biosynthesis